jgi:hypothetical protein
MSDERLNATTNLEGGKCGQKKVSPKHSLVFDFVLQFSDRLLVPLDSLASKNARFFFRCQWAALWIVFTKFLVG